MLVVMAERAAESATGFSAFLLASLKFDLEYEYYKVQWTYKFTGSIILVLNFVMTMIRLIASL